MCLNAVRSDSQQIQIPKGKGAQYQGGLTTKRLIGVSGIGRFSHFVRQRKPDEDPLGRTSVPISDIKQDGDVQAAVYPLPHFSQATMVGLTEFQMV
ncbi:hypothetical protein IFM47457_06273 [Aspergillus lentulus]|nr:hypothetical protein IFM47457_06273 [Aspergillus lentulus]